jgi:hypothetical protein
VREYYYLTGLEDSPYNLTTADALHLGGRGELNCYTYLAEPVILSHFTTELAAATEAEPVARDGETMSPLMFWEKRWARSFFLVIPPAVLTGLEGSEKQLNVTYAEIDNRCNAGSAGEWKGSPFVDSEDWPQKPIRVGIEEHTPLKVTAADVVCWADDLEELANKGRITRRGDDTTSVVSDQTNTEATELRRTQRTLAALAIGLAEKHPGYKHGSKPNALQLAKLATEHLRDGESDRTPHGFSETTARQTITEALKACPELSE